MARSNFEVDLDELRVAHASMGEVVDANSRVAGALPRGGSPLSAATSPRGVPSAGAALARYDRVLRRLADRQARGTAAIAETRRRIVDIEEAYRAADRFG